MSITNGYCTLAEFLAFALEDAGSDSGDDDVIEDLIEAASRYIDSETHRTFYARSETRVFDVPKSRALLLDDDLLSVDTLTNGDSSTIDSADYNLYPLNVPPYGIIKIKASADDWWQKNSAGDAEGVISVEGSWGYASTAPEDIKQACMEIAKAAYRRRTGENTDVVTRVTAAGVVIEPMDVPSLAARIIKSYKRIEL